MTFTTSSGKAELFDTVMLAIGRVPNTAQLGLEKVGIKISDSGKIVADFLDQTGANSVYAIGDAVEGKQKNFMNQ